MYSTFNSRETSSTRKELAVKTFYSSKQNKDN